MKIRRRKEVKEDVLFDALDKMFQYTEISATKEQQQKLFFYLMATISKYMLENADSIIKIGKYICIEKHGNSDQEMFRVTIPYKTYVKQKELKIKTADELYKYYTEGFYESDKLRELVDNFLENMLDYADRQEELCKQQVAKLKALERKKKTKKKSMKKKKKK